VFMLSVIRHFQVLSFSLSLFVLSLAETIGYVSKQKFLFEESKGVEPSFDVILTTVQRISGLEVAQLVETCLASARP
jgi:hypothetical protein